MTNLTPKQQKILSELEKSRKTIKTDAYSMSIGELINLYRDKEIKIEPALQKLFKWEDHQKTKLIESVLIGIPLPEIFVAQKTDGIWYVVDGIQRLSTIYQLVGVLEKSEPLTLTACKYIPSLYESNWKSLPISTQREFKRAKIKINIILTQNSGEAQCELFQRLNPGGTTLTDQEVRNCLILMVSPDFYKKLDALKNYSNFEHCLHLKNYKFGKEFHMELILRMYIGYQGRIAYQKYNPISYAILSDFIDKETLNLIKNEDFDEFIDIFKRTFNKLKSALGKKSFLRYKEAQGNFSGAFTVSVFEMIAAGVAKNIDSIENEKNEALIEKIKAIYSEQQVISLLQPGIKALHRFKGLTEFSKEYFSEKGSS